MHLFGLRRLTATALSFWLGFLACVMGCAQPLLAAPSTQTPISQLNAAANADTNSIADAGPCCHHRRGPLSDSEKSKQHTQTVSCCPLDATLIQRQDPVSPLRSYLNVAQAATTASHPSVQLFAATAADGPALWHLGRDVLLQSRLLRI